MKPIYKYNGGIGAMICNGCRTIISTGPKTEEVLCKKCKENMKLKEKFEKVLKNCKPHFLKFDTNDCIEICDDFAIQFAEWLVIQYNEDSIYPEYNTKELLEMFKKEKGL